MLIVLELAVSGDAFVDASISSAVAMHFATGGSHLAFLHRKHGRKW